VSDVSASLHRFSFTITNDINKSQRQNVLYISVRIFYS